MAWSEVGLGLRGVARSLRSQVGVCGHCILHRGGQEAASEMLRAPAATALLQQGQGPGGEEGFRQLLQGINASSLGPFEIVRMDWKTPSLEILDHSEDAELRDFHVGLLEGVLSGMLREEGRAHLNLGSRRDEHRYWLGALEDVLQIESSGPPRRLSLCHILDQNAELEQKISGISTELGDQERLLSSVLGNSIDAILTMDRERRISSWSPGAERLYGYTAPEILGQKVERLMPQELLESGEIQFLQKEIERVGYVSHYETERILRSGQRVTIDLTIAALHDHRGKLIGYSSLHRDISEKKRMERELLLSEKLSTIGKMSAYVAHEIRNPLSSMGFNLDLLRDELANPKDGNFSEAHALLDAIQNEIGVLTRFTDESLQFARLPKLRLEEVSLQELVLELTDFLSKEIDQCQARLELDLAPGLPSLQADPEKLRQVLLNLIRNALDAMSHGGPIRIALRQNGQHLELAVTDQGVGMSPELMSKIYEPFFTTKPRGTGLGLPLSQQILREHGGMLRCQSAPGQGTTFTLVLPLKP